VPARSCRQLPESPKVPSTPLTLLNAVLPKDLGAKRLAADIAFGPDARQRLDVYGPRGKKAAPAVLFIYGGSWMDGERINYSFVGRALAAKGFVTVIADYRILPAARYPAFIEDGAAALAWMADNIARFGGDPQRLGVVGHSAGAYNAAMLALAPQFLHARGLEGRIGAMAGLSGPYDFFPFDVPATQKTFGKVADPQSTQPVNLVSPAAPPLFLATGDKDRTVYPRNTVRLADTARRVGVPVEERHYPGVGHAGLVLALALPLRWHAPVLADLAAFLHRHLGSA